MRISDWRSDVCSSDLRCHRRALTTKPLRSVSSDLAKAMGWITLSAFLIAFMFMLPKLAGSAVSPLQVAFFRYLAGFCIILPFFLRSYGLRQALPEFATPANRPLTAGHALRGSIGIPGFALGASAVPPIPHTGTASCRETVLQYV